MKPSPLIFICAGTSMILAYGAVALFPPATMGIGTPVADLAGADAVEVARLRTMLEGQARELAALRAQVAERVAPAERHALSPDPLLLEQAIRSWLAENAKEVRVQLAAGGDQEKKTGAKVFSPKEAFLSLQDPALSWDARTAVWAQAHEAGKMAELAAFFADSAKANPQDPQAQSDYGNALIQQTQFEENGIRKGILALQADKQFDKALALDDHHWEARFSKAVSLSFWPAAFGKGKEAIEHFEILARQQEAAKPEPHHVQTHIFLGNMYSQQGKDEEARAAWARGLERFPENQELRGKLGK